MGVTLPQQFSEVQELRGPWMPTCFSLPYVPWPLEKAHGKECFPGVRQVQVNGVVELAHTSS